MKIQFYQHQIDNLVNHLKIELGYDVYPMTNKKDLEEILNVIMFGNKFMESNKDFMQEMEALPTIANKNNT